MERYRVQSDKEKFVWETSWDQTRILWATLANIFRGKDSRAALPTDLIKLSWDKVEEKIELTPERVKEIQAHAMKRFGSTLKNRPVKKKKKRGK